MRFPKVTSAEAISKQIRNKICQLWVKAFGPGSGWYLACCRNTATSGGGGAPFVAAAIAWIFLGRRAEYQSSPKIPVIMPSILTVFLRCQYLMTPSSPICS